MPSKPSDKWDGEDEDDDVKDAWDKSDEEESTSDAPKAIQGGDSIDILDTYWVGFREWLIKTFGTN